jgi:transcriptional regulator with XRE-family HTH domain
LKVRYTINVADLATRLREQRRSLGLSVRDAARAAGVSHATLSRVLRGDHVPDPEQLLLLAQWVDISVEQLISDHKLSDHCEEDADQAEEDLHIPESVARLLRSDHALRPEDVEILMGSFRALYDILRARNEGQIKTKLATPLPTTK